MELQMDRNYGHDEDDRGVTKQQTHILIYIPTIWRNESPNSTPPTANIVTVNGWIWKTLKEETGELGKGCDKEGLGL